VTVAWRGGEEEVRLEVEGPPWRVPDGAAGEVVVRGRAGTYVGRTAFVPLLPDRRFEPETTPRPLPVPRGEAVDRPERWRRALLLTGLLLLLLDLVLVAHPMGRRRPRTAAGRA
jgi:hypothetical protein